MGLSTYTVVIERKPEEVFAYLTDFGRHAEWSPKAYKVESVTDGPIGVGSKFHSVGWLPNDSKHENEVEVTEYQPSSRFGFNAYDRGETFKNQFVLTPQEGGTRVDRIMDMPNPKGFVGIIFPLIFPLIVKPAIQKGMNQLKQRLEAAPA